MDGDGDGDGEEEREKEERKEGWESGKGWKIQPGRIEGGGSLRGRRRRCEAILQKIHNFIAGMII